MRPHAFVFLFAASCGGAIAVEQGPDPDASAPVADAAAPDAAVRPWTGVCNLGNDGKCSGDPQCCSYPYTARRVDLAAGTVGALLPVACSTTPTNADGQCQGEPSTGDYYCFVRQLGDASTEIFVSMFPPLGEKSFTLCDEATRRQACKLDELHGSLPCDR